MKTWEIRINVRGGSELIYDVESEGFPETAMLDALMSPVRRENLPIDEADPTRGTYTAIVPASQIAGVCVAEVLTRSEEQDDAVKKA